MDRHKSDVISIAAQVKGFYNRGESFRINHGSTNSTRQSVLSRSKTVDISHLRYILEVNQKSQTVIVEPNVPMDRLVDTTLKYGLIPPVVMEFPGITVGGGYAGTSGESSSFKHGFFDHTVNYVEIVLANGEIVMASNTERPDLFHGAAGACGTLGVTTLLELQLIEAKPYVETTYFPVASMAAAVEKFQEVIGANGSYDYTDGIMYSKNQGVIVTGRLSNDKGDGYVRTFTNAADPWFYMHAKAICKSEKPNTEYIPLADYCFRYDRGGFWVGRSAFHYFYTPFNRLTRWYLDKFVRTRMMYTALHASGHSKQYVVQDLALPLSNASEFVDFADTEFGIYPLWLCPLQQSPKSIFHPHTSEINTPMLNVGLWGYGPRNYDDFVKVNRRLENKLVGLDGMKWLYAHTYYSEAEFWNIYDRASYDSLREKYNARSLPSIYDKVKMDRQENHEDAIHIRPEHHEQAAYLIYFAHVWGDLTTLAERYESYFRFSEVQSKLTMNVKAWIEAVAKDDSFVPRIKQIFPRYAWFGLPIPPFNPVGVVGVELDKRYWPAEPRAFIVHFTNRYVPIEEIKRRFHDHWQGPHDRPSSLIEEESNEIETDEQQITSLSELARSLRRNWYTDPAEEDWVKMREVARFRRATAGFKVDKPWYPGLPDLEIIEVNTGPTQSQPRMKTQATKKQCGTSSKHAPVHVSQRMGSLPTPAGRARFLAPAPPQLTSVRTSLPQVRPHGHSNNPAHRPASPFSNSGLAKPQSLLPPRPRSSLPDMRVMSVMPSTNIQSRDQYYVLSAELNNQLNAPHISYTNDLHYYHRVHQPLPQPDRPRSSPHIQLQSTPWYPPPNLPPPVASLPAFQSKLRQSESGTRIAIQKATKSSMRM
ncbi:uncharacterized protein KY384_002708 [Bacidia gigantensis]|uniref:uncharacterized protein n=1 Tax=Bacidia gigantensis TaxID=2732470 RepID=UPI001D04138E|nr:uncharacterized protein KY384_002708 [Bacidia gigantensis]KAG8532830.1 hypothetical protein KY384_002708 [Bacidia gigantensis]